MATERDILACLPSAYDDEVCASPGPRTHATRPTPRGAGGESGAAGEKGGGKKNEPPAVGPPPWCWKQRRSALMLPPGGDRAISGDLAPGSDA